MAKTIVYARREKSYGFWAPFVAAGVVFFPLSLQHVDFRSSFSSGLAVSAHKASPAYAAFEDLRESYAPDSPDIPDSGEVLATGTKFEFHSKTATVRRLTLAGMTVRAPAREDIRPVALAIAAQTRRRIVPQTAPILDVQDFSGGLLPLAERKKRLIENLKQEDWSTLTPAMKARELAEEELERSGTMKDRFFRGRSVSVVAGKAQDLSQPVNVSAVAQEATKEMNANPGFAFASATLSTHNFDASTLRPLWLTGDVEMTGGLAFVGPETQMVLKHTMNGQPVEQGKIWITEGKFEIRVEQPTGFLVAELYTPDGKILGQGQINLLDVAASASGPSNRIGDLRIALHPTSEGASFRTVSSYAGGVQSVAVTDAKVEIQAHSDAQRVSAEGFASDSTLSRDSSFVARAVAKNRWPTLVLGQSQEPQDIRLFEKSMIHALIGLSLDKNDQSEALQRAVVWGQVVKDGQTISQAQVEMAGDYKPIYFNEAYLPDPKLNATSKNGLFAFVNVRRGVQALRVRVGAKLFPAQVFPTEDKHVSYVELNVRNKVISQFKIFDGLDIQKAMPAQIRLVGTDDTLTIGQDDFVEYSVAANPFMVEAQGGPEYETSRVTVSGTQQTIYVPLVSRQWLFQLALDRGVAAQTGRGTVVGYIDDPGFEVELTGYAPSETMQIIYFDRDGKALNSNTGVRGGGFIIFNAPEGLQTLYVHPTASRETFSQVVVAEPQFVQVVTH